MSPSEHTAMRDSKTTGMMMLYALPIKRLTEPSSKVFKSSVATSESGASGFAANYIAQWRSKIDRVCM